jgi:hypothetical protein
VPLFEPKTAIRNVAGSGTCESSRRVVFRSAGSRDYTAHGRTAAGSISPNRTTGDVGDFGASRSAFRPRSTEVLGVPQALTPVGQSGTVADDDARFPAFMKTQADEIATSSRSIPGLKITSMTGQTAAEWLSGHDSTRRLVGGEGVAGTRTIHVFGNTGRMGSEIARRRSRTARPDSWKQSLVSALPCDCEEA